MHADKRTQRALGFVVWVVLTTATAPAWGQNRGVVTFPASGKTAKHQLTMTVDTKWVENSGYRPIWITINTSNGMPTKADRVLTVELSGVDWRSDQVISAVVELPQGATTATIEVPAYETSLWYQMRVTTYENGTELKELSTSNQSPVQISERYNNFMSEAFPAIIVIDSDAPNRDQRVAWYNEQVKLILDKQGKSPIPDLRVLINETILSDRGAVNTLIGGGKTGLEVINSLWVLGRIEILNPREMPQQWVNLTSVDLIFVPWADLQGMQVNQPEQFAALTQWVRSGGNLIVTELVEGKASAGDRNQLAKLLGMPKASAGEDWTDRSPFARRAGMDQLRTRGYSGNTYSESYVAEDGEFRVGTDPKGLVPPLEIKVRPWQMGLVIAIEGSPFPGDSRQWTDLLDRIGSDRWMWFQRNGQSQIRDNQHYWQFMIPGVGQAPVTSFQVLISLFVIVIGPVNYFLLRSAGRLNWIIVTVPTGAAMVTIALVGFALFSDGFGVKVRTRGVTLLDQRTGNAITWSRQAYYAGLAPSAGFVFPRDAAVFEINQSVDIRGQDHLILISDNSQHLKRGFFRSRVTHQMLVVRPNKTELKLAITERGDSVIVENLLGVDIQAVVITGKDSKHLFATTDLKAGDKRTLTITSPQIAGEIRDRLSDFDLQLPLGFDQYAYNASNRYRNRYYYQQVPEDSITVSHATSRLERELNESVRSGIPGAPHSYEALVERTSFTPVGVEEFQSELSVEIVRGKW